MKIVDLRPRAERMFAGDPRPRPQRPWHDLAAWMADALVRRRVRGRTPPPNDMLVISVGNLRVGGTGKTPVVLRLAQDLAARSITGGVVTRGYRAPDPTPRVVTPDDVGAGDESRLLTRELQTVGWPVVQAPDRCQGLDLLRQTGCRPRVAILEDGHQTARVGRHVDILIVDRWEQRDGELRPQTGAVLPFGPYRESAQGAMRADIWLMEAEMPTGCAPSTGQAVAGFRRVMNLPAGVNAKDVRVGLVSGLARPERFEQATADLLGEAPLLAVRLPDHADYDATVQQRLGELGRECGISLWLTTAKDEVKLGASWDLATPLQVVQLDVEWNTRPALPELVEERLAEFCR